MASFQQTSPRVLKVRWIVVGLLASCLFTVSTKKALSSDQSQSPPTQSNPIIFGRARFTVLSAALIRLELKNSTAVSFDQRPTLSMPGGGKVPIPPPQFHVEQRSASTICITTESLSLTYDSSVSGGDFTSASVGITLRNGSVDGTTWSPGTPDTGNLLGTRLDLTCYATFDECYSNGLGWGPLSRNGWALWDDTAGVRMEVAPNPQVGYPWYDSSVPCSHDGICSQTEKDWYFFGHGRQYRVALEDFSAVSGGAPLPPLAAFGVWWSTWYNFTAYELTTTVLEGYRKHGLPLDVVVMDMDWHTEPKEPNCTSWGGFTWNRNLFPDPQGFQDFLHGSQNPLGHPLATVLNGHTEDGIGPCEENYTAMCHRIGVNPANRAKIPCQFTSATWTSALFDTMLDPKQISWWWTDYKGCDSPTSGHLPLVSSTGCFSAKSSNSSTAALLWSNYIYDSRIAKTGKRPLVLSRYGGMGNQRYGIGFSGDTQSTWSTLKYQVEMTPTAANVLQAYWSHDIGGYNVYCPSDPQTIAPCKCQEVIQPCNLTTNQCSRADGELYTRWIQFGALSPIFRTHCSHCDRRIWVYPEAEFEAMKAAMLFRDALVPYLSVTSLLPDCAVHLLNTYPDRYTAARTTYDFAVALVHPLYYEYPDHDEAYQYAAKEYFLGDALLVAPVTNGSLKSGVQCAPLKYLGCYVENPLNRLEHGWHSGNSPNQSLEVCADDCGPSRAQYMALESGGNGDTQCVNRVRKQQNEAHTTRYCRCYCGNQLPAESRRAAESDCSIPCSGNKSESCGGIWRASVWTVECSSPPPPPPFSGVSVWLPPGTWVLWNATKIIQSAGMVMSDLTYALHEIPLFVKGGAAIPLRAMAQGETARPITWVVFPGSLNGTGSLYEDDGTTLEYTHVSPRISPAGTNSVVWTTLSYVTDNTGSLMNLVIESTNGSITRQHILQLRRLPSSSAQPSTVTCNGRQLRRIVPPPSSGMGNEPGWWLAGEPQVPTFTSTLGAVIVVLPRVATNMEVSIRFS